MRYMRIQITVGGFPILSVVQSELLGLLLGGSHWILEWNLSDRHALTVLLYPPVVRHRIHLRRCIRPYQEVTQAAARCSRTRLIPIFASFDRFCSQQIGCDLGV